jgi:ParB-like chromosome segregation protein Spo0J
MLPQRLPISQLARHPLQGLVLNDLSQAEFEHLKADIAKSGQRQPIEITHDHKIIDGHHRVRALVELGHTEVIAVIFNESSIEAIEERFLNANLLRRHLDPVSKARVIQQLAKIESRKTGVQIDLHSSEPLRERLASLLGGISGRTIDRYLQLLRLDRPIQDAVGSGQLPMVTALKIESLPRSHRATIAQRIVNGEPPRKVVLEFVNLSPKVEIKDTPEDLYHDLLTFFDSSLEELANHAEEVAGTVRTATPVSQLMARAANFCQRMQSLESHE